MENKELQELDYEITQHFAKNAHLILSEEKLTELIRSIEEVYQEGLRNVNDLDILKFGVIRSVESKRILRIYAPFLLQIWQAYKEDDNVSINQIPG